MRTCLAPLVAVLILTLVPTTSRADCLAPGDPDCVDFFVDFRGTIDFFATGAAFTVNDDQDDRPDRVIDVATVEVPVAEIPPRATLLKAYLYYGGSLYADDDGMDVPDTQVELRLPASNDFVRVEGEQVYRSAAIPGFPELILYSVRADITQIMVEAESSLSGQFSVRGFESDIFNGEFEHTAANASFSIVLIFEEERLPPRNIVLFDGMQEVLGSTVTLDLGGFIVSDQPSGAMTVYALEGDCNPGPDSCDQGNNLAGLEQIKVIGTDPSRSIILQDAFNPPNDIFNRTINTVQPALQNVTGTDIDTFDITPVLEPGDESISVRITTPRAVNGQAGELIGLGYVIVGIDVFAPEFRPDSSIKVSTERGSTLEAYFPGDPLRVTYALSNTGNLPGTEVSMTADLPAIISAFTVLQEPEGATVTVEPKGGPDGKGRIQIDGLTVRHGEVDDLVLLIETECPLAAGGVLNLQADIGPAKEGSAAFTMEVSETLLARDICGPRFFLFGGGGCQHTSAPTNSGWPLGLLALGALWFWRQRRFASAALLLLSLSNTACSGDTEEMLGPDRPAPAALGFLCPGRDGMIVVPSIRGRPPYCVDQYEASLMGGDLGNAIQPPGGDGSTTAIAQSIRFALPAAGVSWHQARAACANAGKRLCTAQEWQLTCRGDTELTYPYGDSYEPGTCNGFRAARDGIVQAGAMIQSIPRDDGFYDAGGCVSAHGAYDLSGNVWEWNADSFLSGTRRGLSGGSFKSNPAGLACVTDDRHANPDEVNETYGFRCCDDF